MFSTFTNFIWGESQEEETGATEEAPGAREVEDWIVVLIRRSPNYVPLLCGV